MKRNETLKPMRKLIINGNGIKEKKFPNNAIKTAKYNM